MSSRVVALGLVVLLPWGANAAAQSLADIARQEEARRKSIASPAKVLTNDDLKRLAPAGSAPQPTPAPAGPAADASAPVQPPQAAAPGATTPKTDAAEDRVQQEEAWRKRITDARAALARTKVLLAGMQSRVNALWADFTARDDPAQRAVIAKDRETALAELARLQQEEKDQTKAIADIEEEARQAGIPPGWLR